MPFAKPKGLLPRLILLSAMLALPGCVAAPPIVAAGSACSSLLPQQWRQGVTGAPLPAGDQVGDWIAFGDAQTAQLDKANERTATSIVVIERCEARDREAVKRSRHKILGLF